MPEPTKNTSAQFFLPALALIFITLKLTGHITWSWLWVLGPIWIPIAFVILFGLTYVLIKALKE